MSVSTGRKVAYSDDDDYSSKDWEIVKDATFDDMRIGDYIVTAPSQSINESRQTELSGIVCMIDYYEYAFDRAVRRGVRGFRLNGMNDVMNCDNDYGLENHLVRLERRSGEE